MKRIDELKQEEYEFSKSGNEEIKEFHARGKVEELTRVLDILTYKRDMESKGSLPCRVIESMIEELNKGAY